MVVLWHLNMTMLVQCYLCLSLPLSLPIRSGYMFILAPFMHYHFLKLRYQSVRNNSVA